MNPFTFCCRASGCGNLTEKYQTSINVYGRRKRILWKTTGKACYFMDSALLTICSKQYLHIVEFQGIEYNTKKIDCGPMFGTFGSRWKVIRQSCRGNIHVNQASDVPSIIFCNFL